MRDLKREAIKVAKLKPSRYILATSIGLTPQNKSDIQALLAGVLAEKDIIGRDDLNNLLGLHPRIEQSHYKLWLASKAVLDRVIHNASTVQSEFDIERVHSDIKRYVRSAAYPRACAMLTTNHVAIISGPPGVGKTSLAKMLLYSYICEGYETVSILTDFQTGPERYQRGKKQIFYFDDFIGATFLGERASAFTRNEDRAILDFVDIVRASPTARLVMTTREHILSQAIAASEKLKQSTLIDNRCVLELRDYSLAQRAEILYNHIYFSDIPPEYRGALLANGLYNEIVRHKKFNPRLVEWLSNYRRVKSASPAAYPDFVRNLLEDPADIWQYAFERQISEAARSVLHALYTYYGKCEPVLLEQAFNALHTHRARCYGFNTAASNCIYVYLDDGIALRVGTLLRVAETVDSDNLLRLALARLEKLLADWEAENISMTDGVSLLSVVRSSKISFDVPREKIQNRIIAALCIDASKGCASDDLRELFSAIEPRDLANHQAGMVQAAVHAYRLHSFSGELDACASAPEFDALRDDLRVIADWTRINFEGQLHAVEERWSEFEQHHLAYDDLRYEQWEEEAHERTDPDRAIDDLFDSLCLSG